MSTHINSFHSSVPLSSFEMQRNKTRLWTWCGHCCCSFMHKVILMEFVFLICQKVIYTFQCHCPCQLQELFLLSIRREEGSSVTFLWNHKGYRGRRGQCGQISQTSTWECVFWRRSISQYQQRTFHCNHGGKGFLILISSNFKIKHNLYFTLTKMFNLILTVRLENSLEMMPSC